MRPRRRSSSRALAIGFLCALAAAGALAARSGGDAGKPSSEQVEALQRALTEPTRRWGRIEVQGMRPAVADLVSGEGVPAESIQGEARAWQGGLREVAAELDAVRTTRSLQPVVAGFRHALAPYLEAARLFEQAARADGEARLALVDQGIAAAKLGARRYNEASMRLQDARRRAGLKPSPDFPDQPAEH